MLYEKICNNVRVSLHDETNEGYDGDYDPQDPNDKLLMRFDVDRLVDGSWEPVDDASYCTHIPADIEPAQAHKIVDFIFNEVYEAVSQHISVKKRCEMLSWIQPTMTHMKMF